MTTFNPTRAAILLLFAATNLTPAVGLAHHKAGHTANCHVFPSSPFCEGVSTEGNEDGSGTSTPEGGSAASQNPTIVPLPPAGILMLSVLGAGALASRQRKHKSLT